MLPLCEAEGIGVIPWSPLARGRLTRDWDASSARAETDEFGKTLYAKTAEADRKVVEAVAAVAARRGLPRAQVALAWVLPKPEVTAPIVGATKARASRRRDRRARRSSSRPRRSPSSRRRTCRTRWSATSSDEAKDRRWPRSKQDSPHSVSCCRRRCGRRRASGTPFTMVRIVGTRAICSGHGPLDADGSIAQPLGKVGAGSSPSSRAMRRRGWSRSRSSPACSARSATSTASSRGRGVRHGQLAPGFNREPAVINGCSALLLELFVVEIGAHARSAVGLFELPFDYSRRDRGRGRDPHLSARWRRHRLLSSPANEGRSSSWKPGSPRSKRSARCSAMRSSRAPSGRCEPGSPRCAPRRRAGGRGADAQAGQHRLHGRRRLDAHERSGSTPRTRAR